MISNMRLASRRMSIANTGEELTPTAWAGDNVPELTEEDTEAGIESQNLYQGRSPSNADVEVSDFSIEQQQPSWCQLLRQSCLPSKDSPKAVPYSGRHRFRLRQRLSDAETYHFERLNHSSFHQLLNRSSKLLEDPHRLLKCWPWFFRPTEKAGEELRDHLITLFTTYILAETLLVSVAMQPFVTSVPTLIAWELKVHGLLWMLVLLADFLSITVTTLCLGYLVANPGKLAYIWVCKIGFWGGVLSVLVLIRTGTALIAITSTSWAIYGQLVGIVCICVALLIVLFAIYASISLERAANSTSHLG